MRSQALHRWLLRGAIGTCWVLGVAANPATTQAAPPPATVLEMPTGLPVPRATLGFVPVGTSPTAALTNSATAPAPSPAACFGHAPDFSWVVGRVEYSSVAKEWRLRYAPADAVDRFGGHLTLIESQHVQYLTDGAYVRVRGHLVNPDHEPGVETYYRVEWFRDADGPAAAVVARQ